jgi:hypothetical protein
LRWRWAVPVVKITSTIISRATRLDIVSQRNGASRDTVADSP